MKLPEHLLHFIWQHQLFDKEGLTSVSGQSIDILTPGTLNHDAGPDFSDALIRIEELVWSGPVEIHFRASEYFEHKHHLDTAYDKIVMHVVWELDIELEHCETVSLKGRVAPEVIEQIRQLVLTKPGLVCSGSLKHVTPEIVRVAWYEAGLKRLMCKSTYWDSALGACGYNYQVLFLCMVARALGGHINGEAMQRLVEILTHENRLLKLMANQGALEPVLLGVAGFVNAASENVYKDKFHRWQVIHQSPLMETYQWKFLRTRQWNFPTVRLAELAAIIRVLPSVERVLNDSNATWLDNARIDHFWVNHYHFDKPYAKPRSPDLTKATKRQIMTNALAPFFHFMGSRSGDSALIADSMNIWKNTGPEQNKYTRIFAKYVGKPGNALESQGILHLYDEYCSAKKCLNCIIGQDIIRST